MSKREMDFRSVGHIIPGVITYLIGLSWIYNTNFDYIVFKQTNKQQRFMTRIFFGSIFNFKNRIFKIFNMSDAFIGLVLGLVGVLLFVILTK
jgi:hypothetical protein